MFAKSMLPYRPASDKMVGILESFRGVDVRVYRLQEHSLLPDGLVVLHEVYVLT
jgi:hypothetical protein